MPSGISSVFLVINPTCPPDSVKIGVKVGIFFQFKASFSSQAQQMAAQRQTLGLDVIVPLLVKIAADHNRIEQINNKIKANRILVILRVATGINKRVLLPDHPLALTPKTQMLQPHPQITTTSRTQHQKHRSTTTTHRSRYHQNTHGYRR